MDDRFIQPTELPGLRGQPMIETLHACDAPASVASPSADCGFAFYESRTFHTGALQDRRIHIRITYEHCLLRLGCQQGNILYATTLLPGEEIRLFELTRFPRVTASTEQVTVHTAFRRALNAMSAARRSTSSSGYADALTDNRTHACPPLATESGGATFPLPGRPGGLGLEVRTTLASDASIHAASEQFSEIAAAASHAVEAERSLVVSRFEEAGFQSTTPRCLKNENACYAVTYYVRRINEIYKISTRAVATEWRVGANWRMLANLEGVGDTLRHLLEDVRRRVPRPGDCSITPRGITLPTDVTIYESELAHGATTEPAPPECPEHFEHPGSQAATACLGREVRRLNRRRSGPVEATTDLD
jgi:thermitase